MNDIDWDWARVTMNKVNWYSAAHCKNDLIGLGWEACDDLIEWKLLYTQHYAHEAWSWTSQTEWSRNMNVLFERRIVVTECSISSSRFNLELKANMKFLVNWWASIIGEAALSTKQHYLHGSPHAGQEPVSARQRVCLKEPVSVYSSPPPAPVSWAEQISILSWLWLHVCSIDLIEPYTCEAQSALS